MKTGRKISLCVLAVMSILFSVLKAHAEEIRAKSKPGDLCLYEWKNPHITNFNVPTQVYSVNGEFFLVDAYNQQILYGTRYSNAPADWNLMGDKLYRPHAIASDGVIYVVVDTDNNRVVSYAKTEEGFQVVECLEEVGRRPHYIEYDAAAGQFYVWSSMTGTMYLYQRMTDGLALALKKTFYIADLDGYYTRSFTIDGDLIYLPSMGRNAIYAVNKSDFTVKAVYPVSPELGGMVQVRHEQNYYYLVTSSDASGEQDKAKIVRSDSLSGFAGDGYENIAGMFSELDGIPYYITHLEDGHYYTPVIVGQTPPYICRFDIVDDKIVNVLNLKY